MMSRNYQHGCLTVAALLLLLQSGLLQARNNPYGAISDPQLNACDNYYWHGQRQDATRCYRELLQPGVATPIRAEAAWALGDLKAANDYFKAAVNAAPNDAAVHTRWGELYVETYQYQDALELFNEALQLDPDYGYANIGAASVLAGNFDAQALSYLEKAMRNKDAPAGVRLRAMLLLAHMDMEESMLDKAADLLDGAGALAGQSGLPELEVYALKAALDLLKGADYSSWIDKALAVNPVYGDAYAIPAYFYWITRRYRQAGEYYRKALALQNDHWQAHMELGINELRFNNVTEARRQLEIAYAGDPYNPKTVNTLRLLDTFDKFDLLPYPAKPEQNRLPDMLLRLNKSEAAVLTPYVGRLAESAIITFSQRYQFKLKEPVVIEIYPNHEDFIVRTIGMPGMGLLGVTFGYLLAMDSPSGKAGEDYHWGSTLWHELAHVFTLESTDHLIPRWFSEGLSVFEEWQTGPIKGIRIPYNVYHAIKENKLLPIAELDKGFIRPVYENQVIVSYMQSGLICDFIDITFGFDRLVAMLAQFKNGADTPQAVEKVLQISTAEFDRRFNKFIQGRYGKLLVNLDEWHRLQVAAIKSLHDSNWEGAIDNAKKAITLFPDYVEYDSPYLTLASAYASQEKPFKQAEILETYWQKGGYAPGPMRTLAKYMYDQDRVKDAVAILQAQNLVTPFDIELHDELGDWLLELQQAQDALNEFQVALAMSPHDLAAAHYRIARAYDAMDEFDNTRTHLMAALEIAPHYRPAQKLLLEISRKQNHEK